MRTEQAAAAAWTRQKKKPTKVGNSRHHGYGKTNWELLVLTASGRRGICKMRLVRADGHLGGPAHVSLFCVFYVILFTHGQERLCDLPKPHLVTCARPIYPSLFFMPLIASRHDRWHRLLPDCRHFMHSRTLYRNSQGRSPCREAMYRAQSRDKAGVWHIYLRDGEQGVQFRPTQGRQGGSGRETGR